MFYTGNSLGFSVMASIPESSTTFPLLGRPHDSLDSKSTLYNISTPRYLGAQYDASTTNLTYTIPSSSSYNGSAEVVLSFLSPITPTSTLRQSIPASYLSIHVKGSFDLDIYVDVNGEKARGWVRTKTCADHWVQGNGSAETAARTSNGTCMKEVNMIMPSSRLGESREVMKSSSRRRLIEPNGELSSSQDRRMLRMSVVHLVFSVIAFRRPGR